MWLTRILWSWFSRRRPVPLPGPLAAALALEVLLASLASALWAAAFLTAGLCRRRA